MPDKNVNQDRPEQNKSQSGANQGGKPFQSGIDKDKHEGREASEGPARESKDTEMGRDRQAGPTRDSDNRESSRDFQTGEPQPSTAERSGSESTRRETQGQDMSKGPGGKMNESRRLNDREEDTGRDERRNISEGDRKDASY